MYPASGWSNVFPAIMDISARAISSRDRHRREPQPTGANITGFSFVGPIEAKRLELLHELVPQASTIAALVNPKFSSAEVRVAAVRDAAGKLGWRMFLKR
jgi:ABC-type uncharacterized transport system substrate-binding protein